MDDSKIFMFPDGGVSMITKTEIENMVVVVMAGIN